MDDDLSSKLPPEILISILEKVGLRDAYRARAFSRTWRRLHDQIRPPRLVLDIYDFLPGGETWRDAEFGIDSDFDDSGGDDDEQHCDCGVDPDSDDSSDKEEGHGGGYRDTLTEASDKLLEDPAEAQLHVPGPSPQRRGDRRQETSPLPLAFGHVPCLTTLTVSNNYDHRNGYVVHKLSRLLANTAVTDLRLNSTGGNIWIQPESQIALNDVFCNLKYLKVRHVHETCGIDWTMLLLQAAPLLKELYIKICDRVNNDNKSVSLGEVTTASIKHYNLIRFTILGCYNIEEIIVPYTCRLVEAAVNLKEIYVRDEAAPCRRIKKRVAGSRAARRYDEPDAPPSTVEDTSPDTTPHGLSFSSSNTVIIIIGASDAASASSFFDPMHFCYDAAPSHSFPIARSSKELGGGKESLPIPTGSSSYLQVEGTSCSHSRSSKELMR
ncbi:hypothetical protein QOZ80_8BG0642500 [Eleusine coracana subsp. coracana]|nr:hypothetical protein QOZ80_8BG0642500 [Eleusine coracana subsp. coracana]